MSMNLIEKQASSHNRIRMPASVVAPYRLPLGSIYVPIGGNTYATRLSNSFNKVLKISSLLMYNDILKGSLK